ncbi:MAG: hypothetical protein PHS47_04925 [Methanocellales archaeon]|nr:hypothetical protein [Methanocellales archaeon]MDD3421622.1 hypothetical protein [Methanocellales archaeon]MDD5447412.1 hypothetical protein [Methanocellales archaeon]
MNNQKKDKEPEKDREPTYTGGYETETVILESDSSKKIRVLKKE